MCHRCRVQNLLYASTHVYNQIFYIRRCIYLLVLHTSQHFCGPFWVWPEEASTHPPVISALWNCLLIAPRQSKTQDARRKRSHALAVNQPNAPPAQIYRSTAFDSFSFKPNSIQSTTMMNVVPAEEESEAEVRREDQDNINNFARLNARLHELRDERDLLKVSELGYLLL